MFPSSPTTDSGTGSTASFLLQGERVVLPGGVAPARIHVEAGRIQGVSSPGEEVPAVELPLVDVGAWTVSPGVVDPHVHVNDPGRESWEGFPAATRAAAAGGITTLVDMPLNSIPATVTPEALEAKVRAATGRCRVDVGFWGGLVPANVGSLEPLWREGVLGFKAFLAPSGVEELPAVTSGQLARALPELARLGAVLLVHAEDAEILSGAERVWHGDLREGQDRRSYRRYLASRPPEAERRAVAGLVVAAAEHGARVHVVHVAAREAVQEISAARRRGVAVSAETCPHYLTFAAEGIPDGATEYKCAPPIRDAAVREGLWRALEEGHLDLIATDHSPCPPELKERESGDFQTAWGGIAGLQVALPAVWTEARRRGFGVEDLARWLSREPARLAGLATKGRILPGFDADFVVWDPEAEFTVRAESLHHRHKLSPWVGRRLSGVVHRTFLRGREVFREGEFPGEPVGRCLRRSRSEEPG